MPNRYITETEQAGVLRRQQSYRERKAEVRERLRKRGLRQYEIWLTDAEVPAVRRMMSRIAENTAATIGDRPGLVGPVLPRGTSRIVEKSTGKAPSKKSR